MYVCSFSLLAQRKRTKRKGTQPLVPPGRDSLRCSPWPNKALANSASPQTVQAPYSAKAVLLGGVTMGKSGVPFRDFMMTQASLEKILPLNLVWSFSP